MAGASHVIKMSSILNFFSEEPRIIQKGEDAVKLNHVKSMTFEEDLLIIRGEVWASQKSKFYNVELTLDNELNFKEATCMCPRGQYLCHHMAALSLYAHYNVSSTQVACRWNTQKTSADAVVTVEELYKPIKKDFRATKRGITKEDKQWFSTKLMDCGASVGYTWLLKEEVSANKPQLPDNESAFCDS